MQLYATTAKYFYCAINEFLPTLQILKSRSSDPQIIEELDDLIEIYTDIAKKIEALNLTMDDPWRYYGGEPNEVTLPINDLTLKQLVSLTQRLLMSWDSQIAKLKSQFHLTDKNRERLSRLVALSEQIRPLFDAPGYVFAEHKSALVTLFPGEDLDQNSVNVSTLHQVNKDMYDIFISHASEDKDFVNDLANALKGSGINVWYDDFVLSWGDDLRPTIDRGLTLSRYGLVVLSKAFLAKKKWTEHELNGLFAREDLGKKVILPIWHGITREDILAYSPSLADRLAKKTSQDTIDEIVLELKELLKK